MTGTKIYTLCIFSDHGVLKNNNSDWTDWGTTYPEPEWIKSPFRNYPITQTKNSTLTIEVIVKAEPSDLAYDLIGDGPDNYVDFTKTGITATGSDQTYTISASATLPNNVATLSKAISWKARCSNVDV